MAPSEIRSKFSTATIEDLLQMSTAVDFSEIYEDKSTDSYTIFGKMFIQVQPIDLLTGTYGSNGSPGEQFHYAGINTQALSMLLQRIYDSSLVEILHKKIWEPAGMSSPAFWSTDIYGAELGFMSLNATPEDFAKLGLIMLNNGQLNGKRIVSSTWVREITLPNKPFLQRGQIYGKWGYQHQWWLAMGSETDFAAIGIWGQMVYINPVHNVVIVKTATDPNFSQHEYESIELFRQLASSLD